MNRLAICEPQCKEGSHETINSSLIYGICKANFDKEVCLFADVTLIENLKSVWADKNIVLENLVFSPLALPAMYEKSEQLFFSIFSSINDYLGSEDCKTVFFTSIHPFLLDIITSKFNFHCTFVLHGKLEELNNSVKNTETKKKLSLLHMVRHPLRSILEYKVQNYENCIKKFESRYSFKEYFPKLLMLDENQYSFIVLSKHIRKNLKLLYNLKNNFFCIEHPFIISNCPIKTINNPYPKFAIFGYGADNSLLSELVSILNNNNMKYEIRNIGMRHYDNPSHNCRFIQPFSSFMPRFIMEEELRNVDFILNFYTSDTYKFTCSGSIAEAICYEKPVIYISNDCYNSFMEPYNFGIECESVIKMANEIVNIIENWNTFLSTEYKVLIKNIKLKKKDIEITQQLKLLKHAICGSKEYKGGET